MKRSLVLAALVMAGTVAPAAGEIVYLTSGRTLSVRSHEVRGETIVLQLRGGGEASFERSLVVRVEPDEVPYQEPTAADGSAGSTLAASPLADVPYADLIDSLSSAHGVDPQLVKALIKVESDYNVKARSPKGAMGLMQIMPATARHYAVRNAYEPRANLQAGIAHLASLLRRFELSVALAAYNAGEAAVQRYGGVPPFPETRSYVRRITSLVSRD